MKYEFCQVKDHDQEKRMYICNELQCIELKDNALLCQKCLCNHKGLHYNKLKVKAINQYNEYMQILNNDMEECEELKKLADEKILNIKEEILKILENLQKQIFVLINKQTMIVKTNQDNASQQMKDSNPSLDILIYYARFSNKKLQKKLSQTKQSMKKIINDIIVDFNEKIREYLMQPDINDYSIIENELQNLQIESIFKQKHPFGYCNQHFTQRSSICTHNECLQQKNIDFFCIRCCKTTHVEHFQDDKLEEYEKLKQIQKAKQIFQENEIKKIHQNGLKLIDDLIQQLKIEQKEQYMKYVVTIKHIKHLEQQFENGLFLQDDKYILGDLLLSLISIKEEELQLKILQHYQKLEKQLKNCKIQDQQKFEEQCNLIENNQNIINQLQKDKEELQQQINQLKQKLLINLIEQNQNFFDQIKKQLKEEHKIQNDHTTTQIEGLKVLNQKNIKIQNDHTTTQIEGLKVLNQKNIKIQNDHTTTQIEALKVLNQKNNATIIQKINQASQATENLDKLVRNIEVKCETYIKSPNKRKDCQMF